MPGTRLDYGVIADAVALRFSERRIGDLVHAYGARGRAIDRQWVRHELPPPVGPGKRIAGGLDLRERGQEVGRDDDGRVRAEERPILAPRLGRRLEERAANGKEQFRRLADDVICPVRCRPERQRDDRTENDLDCQRRGGERAARTPERTSGGD